MRPATVVASSWCPEGTRLRSWRRVRRADLTEIRLGGVEDDRLRKLSDMGAEIDEVLT
jgi:hypothetical protein